MIAEAFVYCWTDWLNEMLYVGFHKGQEDDGYVCSSKSMVSEYNKRPQDFSRSILARGDEQSMRSLEYTILKADNAHKNKKYYNKALPNGVCMSTSEIRKAQSESAKRRKVHGHTGFTHSAEVRKKVQLNNPNRKAIQTPFGHFLSAEVFAIEMGNLSAVSVRKMCRGRVVTKRMAERNVFLREEDIGANTNDLGWSFVK